MTFRPEYPPPMPRYYHVQFGLSRHVGRFAAEAGDLCSGRAVVIRSSRGMELGTVVAEAEAPGEVADRAEILRVAGPEDIERARRLEFDRHRRFEEFRRIF